MAIYDEMQNLANEILSDPEFKQSVIEYVRIVPGSGPIDNPGPSTQVITELNATARGATFKFVSMGLATASDLIVTSAIHPNVEPSEKDFIRIDGEMYKIQQLLPRPAAGTRVVWTFIVQRGQATNRTVS